MPRQKLTHKQKVFADDYLKHGNGAKAAKKAYNIGKLGGKQATNTASVIAVENLQKPNVREYLKGIALEMSHLLHELARKGETDTVRLNAVKDILDRAGYKPVDSVDLTSNGETIKAIEYIVPKQG